ncbi:MULTISPECIES: complex I NDUFA9 subunit family protein [unclassified Limnobacter]|uniref:complex I NDUFA9 subunit family protein n=1 Tax=unclassified Limnobacter TaxID=2630203 RepID=UPI000C651A89|nr:MULTISPECIES: complex I NDUFA9 subunit family protein [unclassified Limnobacter]MAZ08295.1 NAD-dependent dehydratase [Sutterellaceae bacterium]|tara:strand:+ start:14733 stop:15707 length:975 start_codon:yes stop_codon:yes gene_type:complete
MSKTKNVLVIGGSGFLGQAVCNQLAKAGYRITVPTRRYDKAKHLLTLPTCQIIEANIHDRATLGRLVSGQDIVVNLLGVLHSKPGKPYGQNFRVNHVEFPKALCTAMSKHGAKRIVHVSALGVGVQNPAPSMYLRSKTDGEAVVKDSGLAWTILRPSVVFGREDKFLNTFASLAKIAPFIPLAGADARFQPVSVSDVAKAVFACVEDQGKDTLHNTYDLVGTEIFTLKELVKLSARAVGKTPLVFGIPDVAAKAQAFLMELAPGEPLMSRDNVDSMKIDNIRTSGRTFPLPSYECLSVVAHEYLRAKHLPSDLDEFRTRAHRQD